MATGLLRCAAVAFAILAAPAVLKLTATLKFMLVMLGTTVASTQSALVTMASRWRYTLSGDSGTTASTRPGAGAFSARRISNAVTTGLGVWPDTAYVDNTQRTARASDDRTMPAFRATPSAATPAHVPSS